MNQTSQEISSIYGPVESWRFGKSLGIDLIMDPSTCSFNCIYCQLGSIQKITLERKLFIPTNKVINDFKESNWKEADIITFSGSGEPTLAINVGEVIREIKKITSKKITILTNGTLLNRQNVREDVLNADVISVKLDAIDEKSLKIINQPADSINFDSIIAGIKKLKKDIESIGIYRNKPILQIQIMFMPQNKHRIEELAKLLNEIDPNEVALNTPTRPYPSGWDIITRGAHGEDAKKIKFKTTQLKKLTHEEAKEIQTKLADLTGLRILSIYKP